MKNSKEKLKEYWNTVILAKIPQRAHFQKVEDELREHYSLLTWTWKRFLLPLILLYFILGLIFHANIFGPLFLSLLVFFLQQFFAGCRYFSKENRNRPKRKFMVRVVFFTLFCANLPFLCNERKSKSTILCRNKTLP